MDPGFLAFMENAKIALARRANTRAEEQQTGVPQDAFGVYWLKRTAALEKVAEVASRPAIMHSVPRPAIDDLVDALQALDAVQAPTCREGDHETRRAA